MYDFLARQPRFVKFLAAVLMDCFAIVAALFTALCLRLNTNWPMERFIQSMPLLLLLMVVGVGLSYFLNLSSMRLRSYENSAIIRSIVWSIILMIVGFILNALFQLGAPRTVPLIFGFIVFVYSVTLRLNAVAILDYLRGFSAFTPVAVYGAGAAGLQLIAALKNSNEYRPVLFVDDSKSLQGLLISGLKVYSPDSLQKHVNAGRINKIILAVPSVSSVRRREILLGLDALDCEVMELPSYADIVKNNGLLHSLKPIATEELLGRDGVDLDVPELANTYLGKNLLVSGAGGTIGSELCKKLVAIKPKKIVLFEQSEFALYAIDQELLALTKESNIEIVVRLGSVTDVERVRTVIVDENIEIIMHAAAYKHVPIVESNELEGVRTNVVGTYTLAKAAIECGVERFVMISTDKAVRPTNIMGASKRLAEIVLQGLQRKSIETKQKKPASKSKCVFGIVRFGNVLGSSGSVIPLFKEQIRSGGPITLTHIDVTRYFMTINEAAYLVLLAGTFAETSEVFVLDMGEPVKISELARRMIALSGLTEKNEANPNGDIEIKITGLRPGEKLFEELLIGEDTLKTPHPKILRATEVQARQVDTQIIVSQINNLVSKNDTQSLRSLLRKWVEDYNPPTISS